MHAPLTFKPNYKDYIWGGRSLSNWGKTLPEEGNVAESWELSAHPNGMSIVSDGPYAGQSLQSLIDTYGDALLGTGMSDRDRKKFPLLIKLIDAKQDLSIQVHPDDTYAHEHENGEYGKNEMWIVLDAPEDAKLVAGTKPGVTREGFAQAIENDTVLDCMNYVDVKPGDVINIPAGLVHAITAGLIIYEVQQNSDTTYRVYDYNRPSTDGKLRPLHVDKALDVMDFDRQPQARIDGQTIGPKDDRYTRTLLVTNRYFAVERNTIQDTLAESTDDTRFYIYTAVSGEGTLTTMSADGNETEQPVNVGQTFFIPASMGRYTWKNTGDQPLTLIKSYIPDWAILTQDIEAASGSLDQLAEHVGVEPKP